MYKSSNKDDYDILKWLETGTGQFITQNTLFLKKSHNIRRKVGIIPEGLLNLLENLTSIEGQFNMKSIKYIPPIIYMYIYTQALDACTFFFNI